MGGYSREDIDRILGSSESAGTSSSSSRKYTLEDIDTILSGGTLSQPQEQKAYSRRDSLRRINAAKREKESALVFTPAQATTLASTSVPPVNGQSDTLTADTAKEAGRKNRALAHPDVAEIDPTLQLPEVETTQQGEHFSVSDTFIANNPGLARYLQDLNQFRQDYTSGDGKIDMASYEHIAGMSYADRLKRDYDAKVEKAIRNGAYDTRGIQTVPDSAQLAQTRRREEAEMYSGGNERSQAVKRQMEEKQSAQWQALLSGDMESFQRLRQEEANLGVQYNQLIGEEQHDRLEARATGYESVMNNADFVEQTQAGMANEQNPVWYTYTHLDEIASRRERTLSEMNEAIANGDVSGSLSARFTKYLNMTEEEQQVYSYLFQTQGFQKAEEYFQSIEHRLNARRMDMTEVAQFAQENPIGALALSVGSNFLSPTAAIGVADTMYKRHKYGVDMPLDPNDPTMTMAAVTSTLRNHAKANMNGGEALIADVATGVADTLLRLPFGGGWGMTFAGAQAFGTTAYDMALQGVPVDEAVFMAVGSGVIEAVTEKMGIDNLLDKILGKGGKAAGESFLKSVGKQMAIEGAEEFVADWFNTALDEGYHVFFGGGSQSDNLIAQYMAKGKSYEEARLLTFIDIFKGSLYSGLVGALSGGVNAGITQGIGVMNKGVQNTPASSDTSTPDTPVQASPSIPTLADTLADKVNQGQELSDKELMQLRQSDIATRKAFSELTGIPISSEYAEMRAAINATAKQNAQTEQAQAPSAIDTLTTEGYNVNRGDTNETDTGTYRGTAENISQSAQRRAEEVLFPTATRYSSRTSFSTDQRGTTGFEETNDTGLHGNAVRRLTATKSLEEFEQVSVEVGYDITKTSSRTAVAYRRADEQSISQNARACVEALEKFGFRATVIDGTYIRNSNGKTAEVLCEAAALGDREVIVRNNNESDGRECAYHELLHLAFDSKNQAISTAAKHYQQVLIGVFDAGTTDGAYIFGNISDNYPESKRYEELAAYTSGYFGISEQDARDFLGDSVTDAEFAEIKAAHDAFIEAAKQHKPSSPGIKPSAGRAGRNASQQGITANWRNYDATQFAQIEASVSTLRKSGRGGIVFASASLGENGHSPFGEVTSQYVNSASASPTITVPASSGRSYTVQTADLSGIRQDSRAYKQIQLVDAIARWKGADVTFYRGDVLVSATRAQHGPFSDGKTTGQSDDTQYIRRIDANGFIAPDGRIYINLDSARPYTWVLGHELYHAIVTAQSEKRGRSRSFSVGKGPSSPSVLQSKTAEASDIKADITKSVSQYLREQLGESDFNALLSQYDNAEEMVADQMGDLLCDPDFVEHLARSNRTLLERIRDAVRDFIARLKGDGADTRQLRPLSTMERMLSKALSDTEIKRGDDARWSISPDFATELDRWDSNGRPTGGYIHVGTTSDVLVGVGMKRQQLYFDKTKIGKILKKHDGMTLDLIKQVPQLLEDPIAVLESSGHPNRVVAVGELYDMNGKPIIAIVEMDLSGANITNISKIVNAYGKDNISNTFANDHLLYLNPDKKRTTEWFRLLRLQLPAEGTNPDGYISTITPVRRDVNGNFSTGDISSSENAMQRAMRKAGLRSSDDAPKFSLKRATGDTARSAEPSSEKKSAGKAKKNADGDTVYNAEQVAAHLASKRKMSRASLEHLARQAGYDDFDADTTDSELRLDLVDVFDTYADLDTSRKVSYTLTAKKQTAPKSKPAQQAERVADAPATKPTTKPATKSTAKSSANPTTAPNATTTTTKPTTKPATKLTAREARSSTGTRVVKSGNSTYEFQTAEPMVYAFGDKVMEAQVRRVTAAAKAMGATVVWTVGKAKATTKGTRARQLKYAGFSDGNGTVYLNLSQTDSALDTLFGHELMHEMQAQDKTLTSQLYTLYRAYAEENGTWARLQAELRQISEERVIGTGEHAAFEEYVADQFGEMFHDETFAQYACAQELTLWQKICKAVRSLINRLKGVQTRKLTDLESFMLSQVEKYRGVRLLSRSQQRAANRTASLIAEADGRYLPRSEQSAQAQQWQGHAREALAEHAQNFARAAKKGTGAHEIRTYGWQGATIGGVTYDIFIANPDAQRNLTNAQKTEINAVRSLAKALGVEKFAFSAGDAVVRAKGKQAESRYTFDAIHTGDTLIVNLNSEMPYTQALGALWFNDLRMRYPALASELMRTYSRYQAQQGVQYKGKQGQRQLAQDTGAWVSGQLTAQQDMGKLGVRAASSAFGQSLTAQYADAMHMRASSLLEALRNNAEFANLVTENPTRARQLADSLGDWWANARKKNQQRAERILRQAEGKLLYAMRRYSEDGNSRSIQPERTAAKPIAREDGSGRWNSSGEQALESYSEHERRNWQNSKSIVIYENDEQLLSFVDAAIRHENLQKKIYLGKITSSFARQVLEHTGIDIEGFNYTLRASEILKILRSHGNVSAEAMRGQVGITRTDFLLLRPILQSPDSIELSDKLFEGKPVLIFRKNIQNRFTVCAYVSKKHLDLTVQTLFSGIKNRSLSTATDEQASVDTSETHSGTASTTTVPQDDDGVKFSRKKSDAEYLSAIERGDMETAGRMVEQEARDAGYYDDNGEVIPLSERFNEDNDDIRFSRKGNEDSPVTQEEIDALRRIGRKSVNDFTSDDIKVSERWARRFWRQLGVKSPFFRAWFGDWRAHDTTPVTVARKKGADRGVVRNSDTGWNIQVSGKVFNETWNHTKPININARSYLDYLQDIIENAVLLNSCTIGKQKSPNSLFMHNMYAVADIGNGPQLLRLYIEEMNDPNSTDTVKRAYQLQNIEIISSPAGSQGTIGSGVALASSQTADVKSVADLFARVKEKDGKNFHPHEVNPAMLNEDGTPRVFYHGTFENWTVYDLMRNTNQMWGEGIYLAPTEEDARRYGDNVMAFYVRATTNNREAKATGRTRDYTLRRNGDLLVYSPNQIKSATDNIGTFDSDNDDIRFSRKDSSANIDDYTRVQYNTYGWTAVHDVLNGVERAKLYSQFADALAHRNYYPQTSSGEYMIPVGSRYDSNNRLVYISGTMERPRISQVVVVDVDPELIAPDRLIEVIIAYDQRGTENSLQFANAYVGQEVCHRISLSNCENYRRTQRQSSDGQENTSGSRGKRNKRGRLPQSDGDSGGISGSGVRFSRKDLTAEEIRDLLEEERTYLPREILEHLADQISYPYDDDMSDMELQEELADAYDAMCEHAPDARYTMRADGQSSTDSSAEPHSYSQEYTDMGEEYGTIEEGEDVNSRGDQKVPRSTNGTNRVRRGVRTYMEAQSTPDAVLTELEQKILDGSASYTPISNAESAGYARSLIEQDYDRALHDWEVIASGGKAPSPRALALGELLIQDAFSRGDTALATKLIGEVSAVATRAGQVVQAMRMVKRLSPTGQLMHLQRQIDHANEHLLEVHGDKHKPITLNPEILKRLNDLLNRLSQVQGTIARLHERIQTLEEQHEYDEARLAQAQLEREVEQTQQELVRDASEQVPATLADKLNTWRYLMMLGNPRTHIRNFIGNATFMPAVKIKNAIASSIEAAMGKRLGERSKTLRRASKAVRDFARQDAVDMLDMLSGNGKYNNPANLSQPQKVFRSKWLSWINSLSDINSKLLEAEDAVYLKHYYAEALAQYIAANNRTVASVKNDAQFLERARQYAIREAQRATYRDANALATALSEMSRKARGVKGIGGVLYSVVEGTIPFKKTPANIVKRAIEYSPVGLMKALTYDIAQVKKGKISGTEYIDRLSSGLTGTAITALGVLMAALGMVRGRSKDDEDKFEKLQGYQDYSLIIGDMSYTIDWLAPVSMPFFIGVELWDAANGEWEDVQANDIIGALTDISEPVFALSMMDGVRSVMQSYSQEGALTDMAMGAVESYVGQLTPTLGGQLARTIDSKARNAYYNDKTKSWLPAEVQQVINSAKAKIPFLSSTLPEKVDAWGRNANDDTTVAGRAFQNFLSPGYGKKINTTAVDAELERLYEVTGDDSVFPSTASKYFTVSGERYDMSAEEYVQYSKTRGQTAFEIIEQMTRTYTYKQMTIEQQMDCISDAYVLSTALAKSETASGYELGTGAKWHAKAVEEKKKNGTTYAQFILARRK